MSLKDLTKKAHMDAERTEFAKLLMSGNISKRQYALYLLQMLEVYIPLENFAAAQGFFKDLPGLSRVPGILQDFRELGFKPKFDIPVLKSAGNYRDYLVQLGTDPDRKHLILAHLYTRHMGDLYGGQMIKKKVPGSGKFYEFENKDKLISTIRELLTDDLGDEANVAFEHAINIMRELNEYCMEHADTM
jgi:heme oxygenase